MSRHSKNNTALAFFTKSEFEKLDYGTRRERLGRDSMRNFDSCFLCLQRARDPLCCTRGHMACKECIYENILTQKIANNRKDKEYMKHLQRLEEENEIKKKKETEERLTKLEKLQVGISQDDIRTNADPEDEQHKTKKLESTPGKELPSFWVPSLIPDAGPPDVRRPDMKIYCTAEGKFHELKSVKKLFPIKFTTQNVPDKRGDHIPAYMCPTCLKPFHNGMKIAAIQRCGHVMCVNCISRFVKTSFKCYSCEKPCKSKDIIPLYIEGTGFSKLGNVQAQKENVAFQ